MIGPFEAMTLLPEFKELLEDWHASKRQAHLNDIQDHILRLTDRAQSRKIAHSAGYLAALRDFTDFLSTRIDSERKGLGRPIPKTASIALQRIRSAHRPS